MKVLMHNCCGPCSTYSVKRLRELGYELAGFFYNPNIHPYKEFQRRKENFEKFAAAVDLPIIVRDDYNMEDFLKAVVGSSEPRCHICYRMRLAETAKKAKELGFPAISSSLLISPYQLHDKIKEIGEAIAQEYGLKFIYEDFRPGYRESIQMSKDLDLYRQPYCGCIFSEKERYYKPKKK